MLSLIKALWVSMLIGIFYFSASFGNDNSVAHKSNTSLVVEEYKIVSEDVDAPDHIEFGKRIDSKILRKREKWRGVGSKHSIAEINKRLESFQYKLVKNPERTRINPSYHFYHNDKLVLRAIGTIDCFAIDKKNRKFLFTAHQQLENGPPYGRRILVINGGIKDWGHSEIGCPKLLNGSLMWVHEKVRADFRSNFIGEYAVMKDGKEIYTLSINEKGDLVAGAIKSFLTKGNNWILEYTNNVIINGENLGNEKGYSQVFHYRYLKDKPFYFFQQNDKISLSYDDKVLPHQYDEVVHYQCCEPSFFNIQGNENMIRFLALKKGFWYYVEAGIYE